MRKRNYYRIALLIISSTTLFFGFNLLENMREKEAYTIIGTEDNLPERVERGKEIIERILENDWEGEDVGFYSGLDNIIVGVHKVTVYKNQDFLYAVFDLQGRMHQVDGGAVYSLDGGDIWYIKNFHKCVGVGDIYFVEEMFLEIDGIGIKEIAAPYISYDYGETYETFDCIEVEKIVALPGIEGFVYADVQFIDKNAKTIDFDWYILGNQIPFYSMEISYDTGEILNETDIYGLEEGAEEYAESGYLFEGSSRAYLNQEEVERRYFYETMITQDPASTAQEIRCAINEIYARKNYDFTGTEYERYFQDKSWYSPVTGKIVQEELNRYEKANIDFLVDLENQYKNYII